jgi:hypothetical protein
MIRLRAKQEYGHKWRFLLDKGKILIRLCDSTFKIWRCRMWIFLNLHISQILVLGVQLSCTTNFPYGYRSITGPYRFTQRIGSVSPEVGNQQFLPAHRQLFQVYLANCWWPSASMLTCKSLPLRQNVNFLAAKIPKAYLSCEGEMSRY